MGSRGTLNPSGLQSPPSETIPLGVPNWVLTSHSALFLKLRGHCAKECTLISSLTVPSRTSFQWGTITWKPRTPVLRPSLTDLARHRSC
ncbi:unnamed protein product [Larinioides sclopetarius]|uniref:Uncharacterized protein n=1 Tax=Larinioides sclopetarius TaxID=280406 RepID=A0AAV2A4M5_9ARAC